jgi:Type IIA topoisomerase (DNA gyrase/topo II, topoisomerase IV), A subunit
LDPFVSRAVPRPACRLLIGEYTGSKLTPSAEVLLGEPGREASEWAPNFDGILQEPTRWA